MRAGVPPVPEMNIIRERMCQSMLPSEATARKQIVDDAAGRAATLNSTGTWDDIDFADNSRTFWNPQQHTERILLMSKAYRISRDAGHPNAELLKQTQRALDYWLQHDYQNPNWWHNQIGTPLLIGQSVLLLQPEITPEQQNKAVEILRRSTWEKWTGANLVWGVSIQALRGLIQNDADATAQSFNRMWEEVKVTQAEGIQPDHSFHQHGDQFYSGGYGLAYAQDLSRFASYSWGTPFQIPADKMEILNGYILDGEQWLMHGSRFDYSACGREIVRKGKTAVPHNWTSGPISPVGAAYGFFNSVSLLSKQPIPRQAELKTFIARMSGNMNDPLIGNRHFWCSDYMAHHEKGWMSSVRMFSSRLLNTEIVNEEGKKSQHLADGCNLIYVDGNEYFDIFPVWDWMKIPGTTAEQTLAIDEGTRKGIGVKGKTSFVGGVSDGGYGLASMDLARGQLTARKSWFFFNDGFLCLGAGITDTSDINVVTTINQSRLEGKIESAQGWVHHANIGYLVGRRKTTLTDDEQTGSWRDIGMGPDTPVKQKVFKLWIDHGIKPAGASYQYVVLPTATLEQTQKAAEQWPVEVIANTPDLQAAIHPGSQTIACVFAKAGSVDCKGTIIAVDQPCLLLYRAGKVTVSNPKNQPLVVNVQVNGKSVRVALPDGPKAGSSVSTSVAGD